MWSIETKKCELGIDSAIQMQSRIQNTPMRFVTLFLKTRSPLLLFHLRRHQTWAKQTSAELRHYINSAALKPKSFCNSNAVSTASSPWEIVSKKAWQSLILQSKCSQESRTHQLRIVTLFLKVRSPRKSLLCSCCIWVTTKNGLNNRRQRNES